MAAATVMTVTSAFYSIVVELTYSYFKGTELYEELLA